MDDLYALGKRYNGLKARIVRREARMVEFREKRLAFDESLDEFLLKLKEAEGIVCELREGGIGKLSSKSLSEQLQSLEVRVYRYIPLTILIYS